MADLKKLQDDIASQTTIIGGVKLLLASLSQQITDLKAAGSSDKATQDAIDALAAQVETNSADLSGAVAANTPAAPAASAITTDAPAGQTG